MTHWRPARLRAPLLLAATASLLVALAACASHPAGEAAAHADGAAPRGPSGIDLAGIDHSR